MRRAGGICAPRCHAVPLLRARAVGAAQPDGAEPCWVPPPRSPTLPVGLGAPVGSRESLLGCISWGSSGMVMLSKIPSNVSVLLWPGASRLREGTGGEGRAAPVPPEPSPSRQADIEQLDPRGRTPLHLATTLGHLECARVLLKHGADVGKENRSGWTGERGGPCRPPPPSCPGTGTGWARDGHAQPDAAASRGTAHAALRACGSCAVAGSATPRALSPSAPQSCRRL